MANLDIPLVSSVQLDENITEEELEELCYSEDEDVRTAVAFHPLTSLNMLFFLSEYNYLTLEVLQNPMFGLYLETGEQMAVDILATSASFISNVDRLQDLASSPYPEVRSKVAENEKTPSTILDFLVRTQPDLLMLQELVAMNPNVSVETLDFLSLSPNAQARMSVAKREKTSPETLRRLAKDSESIVVRQVASNPNTPLDVLQDLTYHDDDDVVRAAGENLRDKKKNRKKNPVQELDDSLTSQDLSRLALTGTKEDKQAVARHPNASLQTLLDLAMGGFAEDVDHHPLMPLYIEVGSDEAIKILIKVASQTTRAERLDELANSVWTEVRTGVSSNENTWPATLARMIDDHHRYIRSKIARNNNTPPDILAILAKDPEDCVRSGVPQNENTSPDILAILAKDPESDVRYFVACNKKTPKAAMVILAKDINWDVRSMANSTLDLLHDKTR